MTHLVYADEEAPFTGRPVPYSGQNANRHWGRHYANYLYLKFIKDNPRAFPEEKRQAEHEIVICDRKMEHWRRHSNWTVDGAAVERARADAMWRSARGGV